MALTLDAITGISPEYRVKNRKQALTRPDGLNGGAPTAALGSDGGSPAEVNGTLARLPEHGHCATHPSDMATARHCDFAAPGGSLSPRGAGYPWTLTRLP